MGKSFVNFYDILTEFCIESLLEKEVILFVKKSSLLVRGATIAASAVVNAGSAAAGAAAAVSEMGMEGVEEKTEEWLTWICRSLIIFIKCVNMSSLIVIPIRYFFCSYLAEIVNLIITSVGGGVGGKLDLFFKLAGAAVDTFFGWSAVCIYIIPALLLPWIIKKIGSGITIPERYDADEFGEFVKKNAPVYKLMDFLWMEARSFILILKDENPKAEKFKIVVHSVQDVKQAGSVSVRTIFKIFKDLCKELGISTLWITFGVIGGAAVGASLVSSGVFAGVGVVAAAGIGSVLGGGITKYYSAVKDIFAGSKDLTRGDVLCLLHDAYQELCDEEQFKKPENCGSGDELTAVMDFQKTGVARGGAYFHSYSPPPPFFNEQ